MDDFKINIIDKFASYNSASDKSKLPINHLVRGSKNVYKKITGSIATRPGLKRRGSADTTDAGVKSSYEWNTNVGTIRPLRVADNKLQVESDIVTSGTYVWYDLVLTGTLLSPATVYTRFIFDTWWDNDEKTDRLLMVRGDDNLISWSGGMATIESSTLDTITLSGDTTWAAQGFATFIAGEQRVVIEGVEYTYTGGEDTDTLTGVTPDASGISVGAVAIQSLIVEATVPATDYKADYIKVINNQAWVGSYSSRAVYISSDLDFRDFTNAGSYVYGDPDKITMDSNGKGIGISNDGRVILFGGDADMYIITPNTNVTFSYTDGDGNARYMYQKIEKKQLSGLTSSLGHEFIGNLGEYLVWMDQKNRLRALGTFANVDAIKPISLSVQVQNELTEDDFTDGHLRVIQDNDGETVYITAPNNGRDWMYQIRDALDDNGQVTTERLWQPPQVRGIARFAVISGVIYGHSNVNPQLYQVWDTNQWHDDNPADESIPYTCVARFPYDNNKQSEKLLSFDRLYTEGYKSQGLELLATVYFDYQGATGTRDLVIDDGISPASFFTGVIPPSMGTSSLGDNPLGDGIIPEGGQQELLPKFRALNNLDLQDCFEYAIEYYSNEADSRWELLRVGTNVKESSNEPDFIRK
jgi:hypothetical protein